ncbi:hypothetical protein BDR07DRAFT_1478558 [Suillus spraguei]|nr:hypothetical protein BDR07DRAFT_1478558 [Suillus spraguei]
MGQDASSVGLEDRCMLKKMEEHRSEVSKLSVSRDGQLIASGDSGGEVIVWHGETGESLTQTIKFHSRLIYSLDFSPDGTVLATGSYHNTTKLWNTKTWELQGDPIKCGTHVRCVQYSPSGKLLAIATGDDIQIYNTGTRKRVASWEGHTSYNLSLAWTPDGTRLLTGGSTSDPTIREWDTTTWQQVGDPWTGHTHHIYAIAINPTGTLIASASDDNYVRLWKLSVRQTVGIFNHSSSPQCITFSLDGNYILSGGGDETISEWAAMGIHPKACFTRIACIDGDLSIAEELTHDINTDANNHTSYAHRSFVMSRQQDWDHALQDAINSINIQPSLIGYISKGIALCGNGCVPDARAAFDVASMYTDQDPQTIHFLLLIKAIALFGANRHDEANLLLKELAASYPNADIRACLTVQAYLYVQLGIKALGDMSYDEAIDHFTAALNSSDLSSNSDIHEIYEDLVVLFGWDLKSLWLTTHQKRCQAFLSSRKANEALESYTSMMNNIDETTKASCLDWSTGKSLKECSALYAVNGDAALTASEYDRAIDLYSAAIDLNSASDVVFANRSEAKLGKLLWEDALLDAQKVTKLNPSSYAFTIMLSKLDDAPEAQIRDLRHPSEVEDAIHRAVWIELEYAPLRLLNTSTGLLCDRAAQIKAFKTSAKYKELLSFTTKRSDLQMQYIQDVVATYFRCVLLSHRREETEALLHDIQDKVVYELDELGGIAKLQSFCKIAHNTGYGWAWMDTCCIDKRSNTEVQESVNSMFVWYRHSALTIVYLRDVPPSSQPGALARSIWNEREWTFQEFVAPKVAVFYQNDWSLYVNDHSPNHKESPAIMKELEDATGIDARTMLTFRPGMSGAREKLQWASKRVTTLQEDIAYSLFGVFDVHLPVIYGEKKQNALGRLLQEIVARSGDITVLDWIGQPSEFNSCLPADISSYTTPPRTLLPSLSEDQIQTAISLLRRTMPADLALKFYNRLEQLRVPRFANCRLHLPCISFRVTEVKRKRGLPRETPITYGVKADGLHDLLITTDETLVQFSRGKPIRETFLLVRPWDRYLLEVPDFAERPDFADDTESLGDWSEPESSMDDSQMSDDSDELPGGSPEDLSLRTLRLMVRLGHPFDAFLLAQQRLGEYKRIASDYNIVAQVKDIASVDNMDVGYIEIL